ncbi:hypothetical protein [Curtobacterium citreum]|uniref:Type II toxin-antitoxin system RelE/ParE family toxin n=1 Tax=Curtobacterium citreum TaxID=2036 RepID=A0A850DXN1_9MICO|nr:MULTISPECIES: hypothetical protein [Curtobacterium]NUU29681.1 hypothetical protein [Curtobacterium albidum]WIJ45195.1 hypothetical protein QPK07_15960 [Curtobacterium citreum]
MARRSAVPRPVRTTEYTIVFATRSAESGWRDLLATQRNAVATAWDRLSADPLTEDLACHALRGELGTVAHAGRSWTRRQIELKRGARIWFVVDETERVVHLLDVHTHHPNATK